MKILFVCRANVARSQMAAGLYNVARPGGAESAGVIVEQDGQPIRELDRAQPVIEAMQEVGVNISESHSRQVNPEMLKGFDKIIVMAEQNEIPDYIKNDPRTEYWDVKDPKFFPLSEMRKTRDRISQYIDLLLAKTKS